MEMGNEEEEEQFMKQLIHMNFEDLPKGSLYSILYQDSDYRPPRTPNKSLQGINFSDGVRHYEFSDIAKFIENGPLDRHMCMVASSLSGFMYKGLIDCDGVKRRVLIKTWNITPLRLKSYRFYPARLSSEIDLLRKKQVISCPNFPKLVGYSIDKMLAVVYDFWPKCSLKTAIHEMDGFEWKDRMKSAIGLAQAVKSLHAVNHIVGVINPHMIFLDEQLNTKLCEFSVCDLVRSELGDISEGILVTLLGKVAPEILNGQWSRETDVFSFGVVLVELISKQEVGGYNALPTCVLMLPRDACLVNESFDVDPTTKSTITKLARDCLEADLEKRPKIDVVLESLKRCCKGPHRSGSPISPKSTKKPKLEMDSQS